MAVNGIKVILINPDLPRRPLVPPKNEFGFEIKLTQVPVNTLTTVNGYYSVRDSVFIGYEVVVDSDNSTILTTQSPQISITKAQSRLRGGSSDVGLWIRIRSFSISLFEMSESRFQSGPSEDRFQSLRPHMLARPLIIEFSIKARTRWH